MYTPRGTLDRESVIERYGKMVRRVAVQMAARLPSSIELDDLIQAGLIGLVDAVSRFDAAMGVQFDTFAMQRVRGAMLDELRNADWMPRSVRKSQRSIEQAIHAVEQRLGRPAQEREIADELQVPLEEYQRLLSSAKGSQLLYFEDSASEDDEGRIEQMLPHPQVGIDVVVPYSRGDLVSRVHAEGEIDTVDYVETGTRIVARVGAALAAEIEGVATGAAVG